MKNKLLYIGASIAFMFCSCTDLDVDIKSEYTQIPGNPIAQEGLAAECFFAHRNVMANYYKYNGLMSFAGGEQVAVSFDGDYYDGGYSQRATLHASAPDDNNVDWFADMMSGITKCNKVIQTLSTDDGEISQAVAQLRAVRAFFHWTLVDAYGDTPLLDHLYDDGEEITRSPRKEVTEWIVSELNTVMDKLPTTLAANTYGKPTRWMAQALLAKIYLNWNVYTCGDITTYDENATNPKLGDCIAACDDIINSGLFDLSDDYKAKFLPTNGSHIKDFIYAVPHTAENKDGMVLGRFHTWRRGQNDGNGGAGLYNAALTNSVGGCSAMNPDFAELFNLPGDRRNDCLYGNDEDGVVYQYGSNYEKTDIPTTYKGETVKMKKSITLKELTNDAGQVLPLGPSYDHLDCGANMTGWTQGWRTNKFMLNATEYNLYGRNTGNDYPIFRYADILLMKAEAIVRGGNATNGDSPMSLFNQIRNCAKTVEITAAPSLQDILDERGREFFDEGWRRNDLIRFGQYEKGTWLLSTINPNFGDKNKRIFPIPTAVMNSNTNWKQNPSY